MSLLQTLHSYIKYLWKNAPGHKTTPLNADNLNHMENGIADAHTDIAALAEEIEEIKAKVDRGSVSVTANGSKTYAQLLNELYTLVDLSKISKLSVLQIQSSGGYNNAVLNTETSSSLTFTWSYARQNGGSEVRQYIVSNTSGYYQTQGSTYTDNSSTVVASGIKLVIEY